MTPRFRDGLTRPQQPNATLGLLPSQSPPEIADDRIRKTAICSGLTHHPTGVPRNKPIEDPVVTPNRREIQHHPHRTADERLYPCPTCTLLETPTELDRRTRTASYPIIPLDLSIQ